MKNFLGFQRIVNASNPLKERMLNEVSIDGCTADKTIVFDWTGTSMKKNGYVHIKKELAANDFICFENNLTIFLFGNDLTVEGNSMEMGKFIKIEPTKNVIAVESGEWKVKASSATTVDLMGVILTFARLKIDEISGYLIFSSWEGTLNGSLYVKNYGSKPTTSDDIMVFAVNTNSARITGTPSKRFMEIQSIDLLRKVNVTIPRTIIKFPFYLLYLMDEDMKSPGTYNVEGNVKVEAKANADFIPKNNYKVTYKNGLLINKGAINGNNDGENGNGSGNSNGGDPADSKKGDPSLGVGEIAGIVIAAVVVVGVVAFCVVWFAVLKKGCRTNQPIESSSS